MAWILGRQVQTERLEGAKDQTRAERTGHGRQDNDDTRFKITSKGGAMPGTPEERDFTGLEGGEAEQAYDHVRAVMAWFTARIARERRAPLPDEEKIAKWTAERTAAHEDLTRLESADEQEMACLAEVYAARRRELEA